MKCRISFLLKAIGDPRMHAILTDLSASLPFFPTCSAIRGRCAQAGTAPQCADDVSLSPSPRLSFLFKNFILE